MIYTFHAHPTVYRNVMFRSRLEATWAAFFDLAEWTWRYEPIDLEIVLEESRKKFLWTPDFYVEFPCTHSECCMSRDDEGILFFHPEIMHELHVEVKPYSGLEQFKGHVVYEIHDTKWDPPHAGMFGLDPSVTSWVMPHGSGGGTYSVIDWLGGQMDVWAAWAIASNTTRYRGRVKET